MTARRGCSALRAQGYHTIAQDEATCAVYGMPKAAAALNAAVDILPLDRIAGRIGDGGDRARPHAAPLNVGRLRRALRHCTRGACSRSAAR